MQLFHENSRLTQLTVNAYWAAMPCSFVESTIAHPHIATANIRVMASVLCDAVKRA